MPTNEASAATPAYPPWRTFTNALDALARNMPNRIDRSTFPGQSGGGINQLLGAFRFFGFIGDDGKPTAALLSVAVDDEAARKNALRKLIEQKYAPLIALNLMKTTPAEFAEKMTEVYSVSGDTRLKATRFFLAATEHLGIQVSPLLLRDKTKPIATNGTTTRRRRLRPRVATAEEEVEYAAEQGDGTALESRSVQLRSGGTLTLSATTKFLTLSSSDRKFVFDLIDKLEEYERQNDSKVSLES